MVVSSIIMKFNEKIKNVRKNANLSQKQLAYIAGVDVRSYQRYESGERIPNQITLTNICTTLPRYTDYLISVSNLDFDKYLNIITIDFLDTMSNKFYILFIFLFSFIQLEAQQKLSPTATISVVICCQGTELYSAFGHSAFRV